jgi:hypothetical protein
MVYFQMMCEPLHRTGNYRILQIIPENGERLWLVYKVQLICRDTKTNKPLRSVMQSNKNKLVELKDEVINGAIPWNKDSLLLYGFYPYWLKNQRLFCSFVPSESNQNRAWLFYLTSNSNLISTDQLSKTIGASVRCIQD